MHVEQQIRDFIAKDILFSGEGYPYPDNASFLKEGIIDSIGVMELLNFVQTNFKIEIPQNEVTPENFDSIAKLSSLIREKLEKKSQV